MIRRPARRLAMLALAALPLLSSCDLDDQTIGTAPTPAGGADFRVYTALGTSIGAGIQSGGINDSTQRQAYTYLLAKQMGLTPLADWNYPSLRSPGCPAPFTNALTGARVGGASASACALRDPASARPIMHNLSIPFLRVQQVLDITALPFPTIDTLKLASFIVGSRNPIDVLDAAKPTFVTIEIGANDVLRAATQGDAAVLTPSATFDQTMDSIATRVAATGAKVAIANLPNVTLLPHFTRAAVLWCLKNGVCPGVPATAPFNLASFTIDNSCAPAAAVPGALGDTYLLTFPATGAIVSTLAAGRLASINCATDQAMIATAAAPALPSVSAGATVNPAEYTAITAAVTADNAKIAAIAAAHGWALVDFNGALVAQAANIPPIASFSTPTNLFGTLFSQDGVHPSAAGQKIIANAFITAINTTYASGLALVP